MQAQTRVAHDSRMCSLGLTCRAERLCISTLAVAQQPRLWCGSAGVRCGQGLAALDHACGSFTEKTSGEGVRQHGGRAGVQRLQLSQGGGGADRALEERQTLLRSSCDGRRTSRNLSSTTVPLLPRGLPHYGHLLAGSLKVRHHGHTSLLRALRDSCLTCSCAPSPSQDIVTRYASQTGSSRPAALWLGLPRPAGRV